MMIRNRLRRRLAALCLLSAVAFAGAQGAWAVDPSLLLVPPSGSVSEEDADASGVSGEETAPEGLEGRFVTTGGNTRFRVKGGGYAEGFAVIEGQLYYFDPDSHYMEQDGWFSAGEGRFYATPDGPLLTGRAEVEGEAFYFDEEGRWLHGGWFETADGPVLLGDDGRPVTGWVEEGEDWYYYQPDGTLLTSSWYQDPSTGKWYYLLSDGRMAENQWVQDKGEWYFLGGGGVMQRDTVVTTGGHDWYLDKNGQLQVTPAHPLDVPVVRQAPALPNGCEVTALTELLRYNGFPISHTALSRDYLPRQHFTWSGGKMYGPDPYDYFVGNPEDDSGWYCLEGAIIACANRYLSDQGSALRAEKVSGASLEQIESYLKAGYPVMVWMTPGLKPFGYSSVRWTLPDGSAYKPYIGTHALVVTGIDIAGGKISFSDPARGKHTLTIDFFWPIYEAMGKRAVIIR